MTDFTPGPWKVVDGLLVVADDAEGVEPLIAKVDDGDVADEQALADARLIAAAPDLLAALAGMVDNIRFAGATNRYEHESMAQAVIAARAAMAKAQG